MCEEGTMMCSMSTGPEIWDSLSLKCCLGILFHLLKKWLLWIAILYRMLIVWETMLSVLHLCILLFFSLENWNPKRLNNFLKSTAAKRVIRFTLWDWGSALNCRRYRLCEHFWAYTMAKSGLDVGYAEMKGQFPCKRGAKSPFRWHT